MRYALISDIHGNLEALEAVVKALSGEKIDSYLCLGDIVGYGANPKECIEIVRSLKPSVFIAGNHEWGIAGLLDLDYFNEYARDAIEWTKKVLSRAEIEYLKSAHLTYEDELITLVHGGLIEPDKFPYIMDSDDAYSTMKKMKTRLCFIGHTHVSEIYRSDDGHAKLQDGYGITPGKGAKYVVNVGSVGQPRDMDVRASYCIFDTETDRVEIKRLLYDFKITQGKILNAGLNPMLAYRLSEGK